MTAQETQVVNAVETTLSSTMAAGATSLSVASATGIPSVPFYIVVDPLTAAKREFMLIDSAVVGTTLSMTSSAKRNLSGSAGDVEHLSGVTVWISPVCAQLFQDINDRVDDKLTTADHDTRDHSTALGTAVLADLADVAATAPATDDTLAWNGSTWTPATPATGVDYIGVQVFS